MKKLIISVLLAFIALSAVPCFGTTYVERTKSNRDPGTADDKIIQHWTTTNATSLTLTIPIPAVRGMIVRIVINPDNSAAPDANYDIDLTDEDGCYVIDGTNTGGSGLNLSATVTKWFWTSVVDSSGNVMSFAVDGDLSLVVKNAGSAKSGKVTLYLKKP